MTENFSGLKEYISFWSRQVQKQNVYFKIIEKIYDCHTEDKCLQTLFKKALKSD